MSEKLSVDIKKPRGTRDFMPKETKLRRNVEQVIRKTFESFGFQEIQTPIFEQLNLFEIFKKKSSKIRKNKWGSLAVTTEMVILARLQNLHKI